MTQEISKETLIELEAPDYGNVLNLIQEVVQIVQPGFTISMVSILSATEKQNIAMKRDIRRTNAAIARTQRHIQYLMDMNIHDIDNLYQQG